MRYDGGARTIRPDGSIELVGRPGVVNGALGIALLVAVVAVSSRWPNGVPVFYGLGIAGFLLVRSRWVGSRRVLFDAATRSLHVSDRGWKRGDRTVPFSAIREVAVEQREPRRIANAPPVLAVDGEDLLSVQDTYANADLERELQALVGLPLHASPRDRDGISLS